MVLGGQTQAPRQGVAQSHVPTRPLSAGLSQDPAGSAHLLSRTVLGRLRGPLAPTLPRCALPARLAQPGCPVGSARARCLEAAAAGCPRASLSGALLASAAAGPPRSRTALQPGKRHPGSAPPSPGPPSAQHGGGGEPLRAGRERRGSAPRTHPAGPGATRAPKAADA
ncbi:hypothetical protein NDU88_003742 [Pleurodeles waltl]|uniref:Uncharacterized protein n=1 Tax=Pleurodeles waltl TaxID=8319 RepID=A0AAV7V2N1_PLEWA|nr:hypothetical protein NDU88_003742 [Pleurodeles waltl]